MPDAVIVATARTPIGRAFKGSLASLRPDNLASQAVSAALDQVPAISNDEIDDLILGCANPFGEHGFNVARIVAVLTGLTAAPAATVNRGCASSLQALRIAAHAIRSGEGDCFVTGGVECVSRYGPDAGEAFPNPLFSAARERSALRTTGTEPTWTPAAGLPDIYVAMGQTAENVAEFEGVTRDEMDEFAKQSQDRARAAIDTRFYEVDITPVVLADGTEVATDDCPRDATLEGLSALQPAFRPNGRVTAGNSCPLNDGAAAVIVMSDSKARALGITPLARVVASGVSGIDPEIMGLGPVEATRRALGHAGMSMEDIDLVEMNEAFAAQVIPSAKHLRIPMEKLNVHGGAIALGHPFGQTGARLMTTLINGLRVRDQTLGLETMCVGGGQGMAMIVERLS